MAKKAKFTDSQREQYAELAANGTSNVQIAKAMNISIHLATKLRDELETNKAIERVRLTQTIPLKMDKMADVMTAVLNMMGDVRQELCNVKATNNKMAAAMRRLQMENKNLRQTRKDARAEVRKLRQELHRVRGY
ncbi:hypothetical protein AX777_05940 [Sphingobium yanoikuyae]|uniref:Helix-turn-helix domain-containing protein n=1 Tax=Sphingobium yanoikuyae TaxID=13690 RepID=A0A177JNY7_SPHYA|nr:hypothetical protein [Sphingobium yanoikuyae]OAH42778.1 hypothetical protein AX777_05940 [Sphingobium yanoikuyae]